jgi:hypothetical protein
LHSMTAWIVNLAPTVIGALLLWQYVLRRPRRVRAAKRTVVLLSRRPLRSRLTLLLALFVAPLTAMAIADLFLRGSILWGLDLLTCGILLAVWATVLFLLGPHWSHRDWPRR